MPTISPEKKESLIKELAKWFVERRRDITYDEMLPIVSRHLESAEEVEEFLDFIQTPEGTGELRKQLRLEVWKAEPERGFWLGIAGAERKFPLGQVVMTRGVTDLAAENAEFAKFAAESLRRHARGDWGDLGEEDKRENELSLREGFRLLSAYEKPPLPKIWIITEADRSVTTILFPSEY